MVVGEDELIKAAGGDFNLVLLAVLVVSILGGFFYMMRFIMESNTKNNALIIERLDRILDKVTQSQKETAAIFCEKLKEHDEQAKVILELAKDVKSDLDHRPCANGHSDR